LEFVHVRYVVVVVEALKVVEIPAGGIEVPLDTSQGEVREATHLPFHG